MKRRLLSAFLAVMMVLTMAPVAFAADTEPTTEPTTEYVAQVDGNNYATIADAIAAANNKTLTLLKDVNGQIVIPEGKKITLDLNGHAISNSKTAVLNNGNLTICDSSEKKSGVIKSTGNVGIGVGDNSYTTIEYANIQSQEGAVITSYSTGATIIIKDGVFSAADNSVVAGNGSKRDGNANVITINGGTFIGNIQSSGFIACGIYAPWKDIITVNGGNFTVNNGIGIVARAGQVTVNGGTFTCTGSAKGGVGDKKFDMDAAQCVYFDASNPAYPAYNSETDYIKLTGGTFSSDVTKYCANGTMAAAQEDSTYKVVPIPDETITKVDTTASTGTATANTDKIDDETAKAAAEAAANSAVPTVSEKDTAAKELTKEEKGDALNTLLSNSDSGIKLDAEGNVVASNGGTTKVDVTVTKVIYLDIEVNKYDAANHTVAMDVTPKYNVVAKTSAMGDAANPIVVSTDNALTVTEPTTVTLKLDKSFFGADVTNPVAYVQHTKDNKVYVYNTKITPDDTDTTKYKVEFVTPHGFSPMTITTVAPVAKIGDVGYTSLTDAVASAANGDTIKLMADCADEIVISKNVTIECGEFKADKVAAGSGYTKSVSGTTITIAKKSSGSSGGSSSGQTTYKVTTSAVNNGGVNASPSSAEKGASITITLSPDKGYKLDKLTVTDGSGKTVSNVKKSDTVYTFTMPASAVNVGVSYVKADETPSETKFNDVSANDWFASAVDYVTGKGMMNGTADNTFSPKANTTRGMVVTVLYRLENQPSTSAASFTDVASGAYYANAVAWANANGIVSGYGSGKFGPNNKVTREQLAAILYRYAQYKKYDVSGANSLDGYADAQSVSSYAVPALQWANAAGVVTGKSGSKLDPKGNAARAEVAAMLMRFCENVK